MGITVSASDFKAKCLEYFDRLARHEVDSISVTKRGKTVAVVHPPQLTYEEALAVHGSMRGRFIQLDPTCDLVGPIAGDQEFEPEIGNLP